MKKYTIGLDYGTLSARAVLVEVDNGEEICSATFEYPHAVMDGCLPSGKKLGDAWALQHPKDYIDALKIIIPQILKESKVDKKNIIGIGVDFTACTVLPVKNDGKPLCFLTEYQNEPHAFVKLWKHHSAQKYATLINEKASEMGKKWISQYGGKTSSEWLFAKLLQIFVEAPKIYEQTDCFVEAGDWLVWQLTGQLTRSSCMAGYKALWNKKDGYPSCEFFESLATGFGKVVEEKLKGTPKSISQIAGFLTPKSAKIYGLCEGTPIAVCLIDAHASVPSLGIESEGKMLAIMGTSTCHMLLSKSEQHVLGVCGVVEDGILPGFYGYEAGQACVGDHFSWFVDNCVPQSFNEAAKNEGLNIYVYLRSLAEKKHPGESGLIALDWWNGNRSVLVDSDLTGLIIGMTLRTKPDDIYRALIEATAYGTRKIIEVFEDSGVPVHEFYAAGGISQKDPMTMQIYADVINRPIKIANSLNSSALGSAIFGAVAAGKASGGYDDIYEAARKMGKVKEKVYIPISENVIIYNKLYAEYSTLHDYFGKGENDVMKRLKRFRDI